MEKKTFRSVTIALLSMLAVVSLTQVPARNESFETVAPSLSSKRSFSAETERSLVPAAEPSEPKLGVSREVASLQATQTFDVSSAHTGVPTAQPEWRREELGLSSYEVSAEAARESIITDAQILERISQHHQEQVLNAYSALGLEQPRLELQPVVESAQVAPSL